MPRRKPLVTPPDGNNVGRPPTDPWMRPPRRWKPSTTAAPGKLMEERLEEERPGDAIVPLMNGVGKISIGQARYAQEELRLLMTSTEVDGPGLVSALHALAEGRPDAVSREQREILRQEELIDRAGEVRRRIKAVILAGYRLSPAGPVITEPLDLSNPEHEAASERHRDYMEALSRQGRKQFRLIAAEWKSRDKRNGDDQGRS
jgi:hypothetical protein